MWWGWLFLLNRHGQLVGVSSLAGRRALATAAVYNATKAALSVFLEGLRMDLAPAGIEVSDVQPGFVATEMTAKNRFPMPFLIPAEKAATAIVRGLERGAFEIHFPRRFSRLLKLVNLLPDFLYFWCVRKFTGL